MEREYLRHQRGAEVETHRGKERDEGLTAGAALGELTLPQEKRGQSGEYHRAVNTIATLKRR